MYAKAFGCALVNVLGFAALYFLLGSEITDERIGGQSLHVDRERLVTTTQCRKNGTLPRGWCMDDDSVPRYVGTELSTAVNVTYHSYDGYRKCLAGKTVVFIGDSRVRYQYMHLASYIKTKKFMTCQDRNPQMNTSGFGECNLIDEKLRPDLGWGKWYNLSTNMLMDDAQQSLCDCYRPDPMDPKVTFENRYTKRQTPFGEIELIYLQSYIDQIHINNQFPPLLPYDDFAGRCRPSECSPAKRNDSFVGGLHAALQDALPLICPDDGECHAFINYGWDYMFNFEKQSELSCLMEEYERQHPRIKLYLITGPEDRWRPARSYFDESKLKCKVKVLDRNTPSKGVPPTWYWDYFHVLSILNEEYNHRLVKMMCPIGGDKE